MSMLPFFQWCEASTLGSSIRDSQWIFPLVEGFHLLGFAVVGGAILLVDLRLLGLTMRDQPIERLAKETKPWLIGGVTTMVVSGLLLFLPEAVKCYYSTPFWIKMASLVLAVAFALTVRRRQVRSADDTRVIRNRLVAALSIALWAGVAWGGRWIGFSG